MSMSSGDLLSIQPTDLKFPFELRKQISSSLQLTNKTDEYVAFKVKTTNPKTYYVRPNTGIVLPGATCDVTVTMHAQKEAPQDMQCKDKFLLQSVTAPNSATWKDITCAMFNKESGKVVEEFKLGVIYVPANPPPQGSSPRTSGVDLLSIQPTYLKFPFELRKQISSSLQLTNKTDAYVAFKAKTTNKMKYCVRPNTGIVLPGATCEVTVTMQAQKEAPQDMQCKDKFLFQSVTTPNGATWKDITPEMFNKESEKVVEEFKLGVIYVPANPLLPAPERSSPRASGVENGNQATYLFEVEKSPTKLQKQSKSMNKEKNILGKVISLLGKAKTKIGSQFELWNRQKAIMAGYVELPNKEKLTLASEKTQLETDVELLNKEKAKLQSDKDRLQTDIELLKKEKDALHKILNEEKAEFIRSAIQEVNESINERVKALAENEKMVARDTQELREQLIKV